MPLHSYLYQNNGMVPAIANKFPVCFLMPLLWQNHSPLILTSFLSAVSRCTEHRSSHTVQRATLVVISMICHTKFDLVLITLFPLLIVKWSSFVLNFLIWVFGRRINSDLRSLIAHRLCWHTHAQSEGLSHVHTCICKKTKVIYFCLYLWIKKSNY